jgi:transposase
MLGTIHKAVHALLQLLKEVGLSCQVPTGCRWREMPKKYGSYATAWRRLRRLQEAGIWDKIIEFLKSRSCKCVAIDSTTVEAKKRWRSRIRWIQA